SPFFIVHGPVQVPVMSAAYIAAASAKTPNRSFLTGESSVGYILAGGAESSDEVAYCFGLTSLPLKSVSPERVSRIRKKNGRSARKTGVGSMAIDTSATDTPVAAAASVPSSATSMNALWTTRASRRSRRPFMPEKSAEAENADGIPRDASVSASEN